VTACQWDSYAPVVPSHLMGGQHRRSSKARCLKLQ
jgi:hypothetical protein